MTAPTFVGAGTPAYTASNGVALSPGLPTGWAENDIHVLLIHTSSNVDLPEPSGWTKLSPSGAAENNTSAQRVELWWRRAVSGDTAPSVGNISSATVRGARIYGIRGCPTTGDPFAGMSRSNNAASATVSTASMTPSVNDTLNLFLCAYEDDPSAASQPASWSTFTVSTSSLGSDMALGHATLTQGTAAALNPSTTVSGGTFANSPNVGILLSFKPFVAATWTHRGSNQVLGHPGDPHPIAAVFPVTPDAGDLIVIAATLFNEGDITTPAGYTLIRHTTTDAAFNRAAAYYKIAAGGDAAPSLATAFPGFGELAITAMVFSGQGVIPSSPLDVESGQNIASGSTASTAPSITTTQDGDLLIHVANRISNPGTITHSPPSGYTQTADLGAGATDYASASTSYAVQASAGATGSVAGTWSSAPGYPLHAHLIAFRAGDAPPSIPASLTVTAATAPAAGGTVTLDAASKITVTSASAPAAAGAVTLDAASTLAVAPATAPAAGGPVVLSGAVAATLTVDAATAAGDSNATLAGQAVLPGSAASAASAADGTFLASSAFSVAAASAPASADAALSGQIAASFSVDPASASAEGGSVALTGQIAASLAVDAAAADGDADGAISAGAAFAADPAGAPAQNPAVTLTGESTIPGTLGANAATADAAAFSSLSGQIAATFSAGTASADADGGTVVLGASAAFSVGTASAPAASFGAFVTAARLVIVAAPAPASGGVVGLGAGQAGVFTIAPAPASAEASTALLGAALFAVIPAPSGADAGGALTSASVLGVIAADAGAEAFGDLVEPIVYPPPVRTYDAGGAGTRSPAGRTATAWRAPRLAAVIDAGDS